MEKAQGRTIQPRGGKEATSHRTLAAGRKLSSPNSVEDTLLQLKTRREMEEHLSRGMKLRPHHVLSFVLPSL